MYDKIMALYPSLTQEDFLTVILLQNDSDGKGDYIKEWNHPILAKPTDEQLNG
jgi:XkdW protein